MDKCFNAFTLFKGCILKDLALYRVVNCNVGMSTLKKLAETLENGL